MKILQSHIVPPDTPAERISEYARMIFPNIPSRKGIKKAILRNEILLNGKSVETGRWVQPGNQIDWVDLELKAPKVLALKLEVVFEDEHLAVINKPPGIIVSGNQFRTVENALLHNISKSMEQDALRKPRAVHRLDSPTSGLLLVAKTALAHLRLSQQFEAKMILKKYQAIVIGNIDEAGVLEKTIDGKTALTRFEKIKTVPSLKNKWLSLVDLFPQTGRTHQLRIHLSDFGFPILGDAMYGKEGLILKRKGLFLCAVELVFSHPKTDERVEVKINAPQKYETLLRREERRWQKYQS
ncbi:MAG: RluA family pseudouridine synthase [Saprospiraceae bacterium]